MKHSILTFTIILCFSFSVFTQISEYGLPYSFVNSNKSHLANFIPKYIIEKIDIESFKNEDILMDNKEIPWRFGVNIDVSISNKKHGIWDTLSDGTKIWRISIVSKGALTLNLTFNKYKLPKGAKLFIYSADKTDIIGAFTHKNNQVDEFFATTLISGDEIIIEYSEPSEVEFEGELEINTVTHAYRGISQYFKSFDSSENCNINVACPQSLGYDDQIRSVCMLVTGGNGFCTGVLLNNTMQDEVPYVLTANHCYSNPSTLVYWFNWESEFCENPLQKPSYDAMSGSVLRAKWSETDFCLFELLQIPPSDYNVFYAGWNRTDELSLTEKVVGIHHPSGDIKKISWANEGVLATSYLQNQEHGDSSYWRIAKWSDGTTTESGSSGSPLFDINKRVIGQLRGGYSSCNNVSSDWYGRFTSSWYGNNTPETSLKDWLDPNDKDLAFIDGFDPKWNYDYDLQLLQILMPKNAYCTSEATEIIFVMKNVGKEEVTSAKLSYVLNDKEKSLNWGGSLNKGESIVVAIDTVYLDYGNQYFLKAFVSNPNGLLDQNNDNDTLIKQINVAEKFLLPLYEDFEGLHLVPICWEQKYVKGWIDWKKNSGGQYAKPQTAYSGAWNAFLYSTMSDNFATKIISPPLDFSFVSNSILTFAHAQASKAGKYNDKLNVYVKMLSDEEWRLLASFNEPIEEWEIQTVQIPNDITSICQIAFEGVLEGGYGVCIDKVQISGHNASVEDKINSDMLFIFPNPAKNEVFIKGKFNDKNYDLLLSEINGKSVKVLTNNKVENNVIRFDITNVSSGVYVLYVYSDNQCFVKKLIIQD